MRMIVQLTKQDRDINITLSENNKELEVEFGEVFEIGNGRPEGIEEYDGAYQIIPKREAQELPTKQKFLTENIEIKEIPVYSTSNNAGGNTVYIAKEVV